MKTTSTIIAVAILVWTGAAAGELVANGGFETNSGNGSDPTGWTEIPNSYGAYDGLKYSGGWSLHAGAGYNYGGRYQDITTVVGETYDLDFWATGFNASGAATQQGTVRVGTVASPGLYVDSAFSVQREDTGGWSSFSHSFTASDTTTRVTFINDGNGTNGYAVNVDDVSVHLPGVILSDNFNSNTPPANPAGWTCEEDGSATISTVTDASDFFGEGTSNVAVRLRDPDGSSGLKISRGMTHPASGVITLSLDFYEPTGTGVAYTHFRIGRTDLVGGRGNLLAELAIGDGVILGSTETYDLATPYRIDMVYNTSGAALTDYAGTEDLANNCYDVWMTNLLTNTSVVVLDEQARLTTFDPSVIGAAMFSGNIQESYIDNVILRDEAFVDLVPIPEPATMTLLLVGGVGMLAKKRKK